MKTVTVSQKFQVIIPKEIRKTLNISPGEEIQVLQYDNRIEYIPVKNIKKMRGFLKGLSSSIKRDKDRI